MSEEVPEPLLRITAEELETAVPPRTAERPSRTSQLAVAAFVLSLLGIPLVGFVLGPVAIGCGLLAVGAIQGRSQLRGLRMAVAGIALGSLDLIGWIVGVSMVLSRTTPPPVAEPPIVASAQRSADGVATAAPHIRRALLANVSLRCREREGRIAAGSGVVVGREGADYYALTNRHVVECTGRDGVLSAATLGGEYRPAEVTWRAPERVDLALVRLDPGTGPFPEVVLLRDDPLPSVGSRVFAVGNPLGYEASFTAGVLSAIRATRHGSGELRILQVQASVNHGNSGGGLYDEAGRLVGINTWIADRAVAEGLGFAIATADLVPLLRDSRAPGSAASLRGPRGDASP